MRPRRRILLYCQNEVRAGVLKLMLETRGKYKVLVIANEADALWMLQSSPWDYFSLLLAECASYSQESNELVRQAKNIVRDLPMVIYAPTITSYECGSHADYFIPETFCNSEEILLRVGMLAQRKRGPKGPRAVRAERACA